MRGARHANAKRLRGYMCGAHHRRTVVAVLGAVLFILWGPGPGLAQPPQADLHLPSREALDIVADQLGYPLRHNLPWVGVDEFARTCLWDEPSWAPAGARIALAAGPGRLARQLFVCDLDDGSVRRLIDRPAHIQRPLWSPGGEYLAFESTHTGRHAVTILNADTGSPVMTVDVREWTLLSAWAPDSSAIIVEQATASGDPRWRALVRHDLHGTVTELLDPTALPPDVPTQVAEQLRLHGLGGRAEVNFHPAGEQLAVRWPSTTWSGDVLLDTRPGRPGSVYRFPPLELRVQAGVPNAVRALRTEEELPMSVSWRDDGQAAAYVARPPQVRRRSWTMIADLASGTARILPDYLLGPPAWSPSGQYLAISQSRPAVVDSRGRLIWRAPEDSQCLAPVWAPERDALAFVATEWPDGDAGVLVYEIDPGGASGPRRLSSLVPEATVNLPLGGRLAWSADGEWLATTHAVDRMDHVICIHVDTGHQVDVTALCLAERW